MLDRSNVRLLARKRAQLYGRKGDYLISWWFGPRTWPHWAVGEWRVWYAPGPHMRPLSSDVEVFEVPSKPVLGLSGMPDLPGAAFGPWGKDFPSLCEWLCAAVWSDATPMGKTRLTLTRDGSAVKALLQIADLGGLRVEASGVHPVGALTALEVLLKSPTPPWQLDPYPIGVSSRKKK